MGFKENIYSHVLRLHLHACGHGQIHTHAHAHTHTCTHTCIHTHTHTCTHTHTHTHTQICIHTYTHTHTCTHSQTHTCVWKHWVSTTSDIWSRRHQNFQTYGAFVWFEKMDINPWTSVLFIIISWRSGTGASCEPHILFLPLFCYTGFVIDSIIHVCCMILYTKWYTYSPPVAVFFWFFFSSIFVGVIVWWLWLHR